MKKNEKVEIEKKEKENSKIGEKKEAEPHTANNFNSWSASMYERLQRVHGRVLKVQTKENQSEAEFKDFQQVRNFFKFQKSSNFVLTCHFCFCLRAFIVMEKHKKTLKTTILKRI